MSDEEKDDNVKFDLAADQINNPEKYRAPKVRKKRAPSPLYKANNRGGYGNPPIRSQFKPGNKGGPGRRKGETNLENAFRNLFKGTTPVKRNGKIAHIPMAEAIAERIRKEITQGSTRGLELGMSLMREFGPKPGQEKLHTDDFTRDEFEIAARVLLRLTNRDPHPPRESSREARSSLPPRPPLEGLYRIYRREDGHIGFESLDRPGQPTLLEDRHRDSPPAANLDVDD